MVDNRSRVARVRVARFLWLFSAAVSAPALAAEPAPVHVREQAAAYSSWPSRVGTVSSGVTFEGRPEPYTKMWRLRRETPELRELVFAQAADVLPGAAPAPPPPALPSSSISAERCRAHGLCRVTLLAGHGLPFERGEDTVQVVAKKDVTFHRPHLVCRAGPIVGIATPTAAKNPGLFAPFGVAFEDARGWMLTLAHTVRIHAGDEAVEPPPCKLADASAKVIVGGTSPTPIMGQFALRPDDARAVGKAMRTSSRVAFELAQRLAVRAWTYADRWCDDAVRQVVFLTEDEEGVLASKDEALRARFLDRILLRHAEMYAEVAPADCTRALSRMAEAKRFAREKKLRHLHFGF